MATTPSLHRTDRSPTFRARWLAKPAASPDEPRHLRRQRNLYAGAALVLVVGSIGAALPQRLDRHDRHEALNGRILQLQAEITAEQTRIRETQAAILAAQAELAAAP